MTENEKPDVKETMPGLQQASPEMQEAAKRGFYGNTIQCTCTSLGVKSECPVHGDKKV